MWLTIYTESQLQIQEAAARSILSPRHPILRSAGEHHRCLDESPRLAAAVSDGAHGNELRFVESALAD